MSDEPHFHLSGFVNNQNFRYWENENVIQIHHKPLHSEGYCVVCDINFGIIGPSVFQNDSEIAQQ
jgi:hypothetical protein